MGFKHAIDILSCRNGDKVQRLLHLDPVVAFSKIFKKLDSLDLNFNEKSLIVILIAESRQEGLKGSLVSKSSTPFLRCIGVTNTNRA